MMFSVRVSAHSGGGNSEFSGCFLFFAEDKSRFKGIELHVGECNMKVVTNTVLGKLIYNFLFVTLWCEIVVILGEIKLQFWTFWKC